MSVSDPEPEDIDADEFPLSEDGLDVFVNAAGGLDGLPEWVSVEN